METRQNTTQTLTDFLSARLDEDERDGAWHTDWCAEVASDERPCDCTGPDRLRREVKAKRRIVQMHHPHNHHGDHGAYVFCTVCQWDHGDDSPRIDMGLEEFGKPCPTLRALASVYADHPDYSDEWAL